MNVEEFKAVLTRLAAELENMWIEKEVCRAFVIASHGATPEVLQKALDDALLPDSQNRRDARERFSEMWEALQEKGMSAWYEDLLTHLPPSGKPS